MPQRFGTVFLSASLTAAFLLVVLAAPETMLLLVPLAAWCVGVAAAEAVYRVHIEVTGEAVTVRTRRLARADDVRIVPRSTVRALRVGATHVGEVGTTWSLSLDTTAGPVALRGSVGEVAEVAERVRELHAVLPLPVVASLDGLPLAEGWWHPVGAAR